MVSNDLMVSTDSKSKPIGSKSIQINANVTRSAIIAVQENI